MRHTIHERGSLSVWIPFAVMMGILFIGIVVDGAAIIKGQRAAQSVAAEAARTAGQQLAGSVSIRGGAPVLDTAAATSAAYAYLTAQGMTGTVTIDGDLVTVEATDTRELTVLSAIGLAPVEVTGHAQSRSVRAYQGVER